MPPTHGRREPSARGSSSRCGARRGMPLSTCRRNGVLVAAPGSRGSRTISRPRRATTASSRRSTIRSIPARPVSVHLGVSSPFIRNNNNVTWRNFQPSTSSPARAERVATRPNSSLMKGAPDRNGLRPGDPPAPPPARPRRLGAAAGVVPAWTGLRRVRKPESCRLAPSAGIADTAASTAVAAGGSSSSGSVAGEVGAASLPFRFTAEEKLSDAACTVAIRQLYDGIEIGRVTWGLRPARTVAGRFSSSRPSCGHESCDPYPFERRFARRRPRERGTVSFPSLPSR